MEPNRIRPLGKPREEPKPADTAPQDGHRVAQGDKVFEIAGFRDQNKVAILISVGLKPAESQHVRVAALTPNAEPIEGGPQWALPVPPPPPADAPAVVDLAAAAERVEGAASDG